MRYLSLHFDCDLQLVQRRKEKEKAYSRDIWDLYSYITGFSEHFPRDILKSQCKIAVFGDDKIKPDSDVPSHTEKAEDMPNNMRYLCEEQEHYLTVLQNKVQTQEKEIMYLRKAGTNMKDLYDLMLDKVTGIEVLLRDITESGSFKLPVAVIHVVVDNKLPQMVPS